MKKYLALLLLLVYSIAIAQITSETFFAEDDSQELNEDLEALDDLSDNPVDLNKGHIDRLLIIPGISSFDIAELAQILKHHNINNEADLIKAGYAQTKLELISPYIVFAKKEKVKLNIRTEHAYKDSQFYNNRARIKLTSNSLEAGAIVDRDPQESIKELFTSFYLQKSTKKFRLILGNYRVSWASGILHAPAFSRYFSRSAISTVNKYNKTIKPYFSTTEDGYFQGAALEYQKGKFCLNSWLSQTDFKNPMRHAGISLQYQFKHIHTGICLERTYQDSTSFYIPARDITDSFSLSAACSFSRFSARTELARSAGSNAALVNMQYGTARFKQILLFRSYQNAFPQLYGNPVSRTSDFSGEQGLYYGLSWKITGNLKADIYSDLWKKDIVEETPYVATISKEQMLNLEWTPGRVAASGYMRYRTYEDDFTVDGSPETALIRIFTAKASCSYHFPAITLRSDVNFKSEDISGISSMNSIACFQQLKWDIGSFQVWYRLTFFRAELPLYVYENNVRGLSTNVCFSDDGIRNALKLKYSLKNYRMELKAYYQSSEQPKKGVSLSLTAKI